MVYEVQHIIKWTQNQARIPSTVVPVVIKIKEKKVESHNTVGCIGLFLEEQTLTIFLINFDNVFGFSTSTIQYIGLF